jgi:hypothetical protein
LEFFTINANNFLMIKMTNSLKNNPLIYNFVNFLKNFLKILDKLVTSILLFSVRPVPLKNFIIITGADSSHYKSLVQLLSSIILYEKNTKVIVFDLGLTDLEKNELNEKIKTIETIEIRKFDYSKYPKFFNIKINAGEYAWKPIIISNILNEFKCSVIWMDAGNVILSPLKTIRKILNLTGFYSPYSEKKISSWTHPKTLKFLEASNKILEKRNLNGACIAVNYNFSEVKKVIDKWKQCALMKECIAPEGSSRKNHRQDQATLSVIAYQGNIVNLLFKKFYGFKIQQDIN